ncbi:MAG: MATE family efflux transporter [Clostridium sp.]|nr:MATE family efflux transporter [Clostridium sp.]
MTDNEETQYKKMIEDPIPKLITSLAVPTVLSQLITTIYNTADTYFVAQIGTSATAAVGVVFSLMSIIQAVGFGLGMGSNSLISRNLGAKNNDAANKYGNSSFITAIIFGLCLMIFGLINLQPFMRVLGSTETMLDYSCSYGKYILIGAPIMCSSFVLNNILRSEGHALYAMWGLCAGGILNMILDPIFIFGFNMGISGAALATILSQIVSFVILLSIFIGNKSIVKLGWKYISMNISDYLLIIKTGFPTICRQMLGSVSSALLNIKAAVYGDAAVGAITIANKIYMLVRNVILGIGQGFQPVAGYNYGAKNKKRVKEAFIFSCTVGTVICTIAALIIGFNASSVIDWFRKDDMEVIRIGTQTLYFACTVMPLMAYSTYVNQMYQCLGFSTQATFLASCRQGICFIPLVIILPEIIGVIGVEVSQSAADLITFIISLPFQIKFFKKQLS